jgi:RNA polymerase sigma factor (sigma-70 family)
MKPFEQNQMKKDSSDDDSASLLRRAIRGDRSALSALFVLHVPPLRRWAHGRLPAWARAFGDTVDLVQEAVMNTLPRLNQFEVTGGRALQGYLRNAVQNRIFDIMRRAELRTRAGEITGEEPAAGLPSPLSLAITAQEYERYQSALARLKPDDQTLIVGRFEFGYSYEQLALITRKSVDAARVSLKRAVKRLIAEMKRG